VGVDGKPMPVTGRPWMPDDDVVTVALRGVPDRIKKGKRPNINDAISVREHFAEPLFLNVTSKHFRDEIFSGFFFVVLFARKQCYMEFLLKANETIRLIENRKKLSYITDSTSSESSSSDAEPDDDSDHAPMVCLEPFDELEKVREARKVLCYVPLDLMETKDSERALQKMQSAERKVRRNQVAECYASLWMQCGSFWFWLFFFPLFASSLCHYFFRWVDDDDRFCAAHMLETKDYVYDCFSMVGTVLVIPE
jgi:hypothetical protein